MIRVGQIIITGLFLMLPNVYNTNLEKTVWETILRIILFTFTSWFLLFASIIFQDDDDEFEFFNKFWWLLLIHRYMIPLVAFVWMNEIMRLSKFFSNNSKTVPNNTKPMLPEATPLLQPIKEQSEEQVQKSSPAAKVPTTMFAPKQDAEPRQRMLRRGWKSRSLQPKLSASEQIAKLQALASGVETVV